ncbi:MAG: glutaredoxin family protein [Alcanivoracaceae bacterium]
MQAELLTTTGCHLCEQALTLIQRAAPRLELVLVDIGEQDALIERYGTRIPVLRQGGRELDWPFSLLDVRAWLDANER